MGIGPFQPFQSSNLSLRLISLWLSFCTLRSNRSWSPEPKVFVLRVRGRRTAVIGLVFVLCDRVRTPAPFGGIARFENSQNVKMSGAIARSVATRLPEFKPPDRGPGSVQTVWGNFHVSRFSKRRNDQK